PRVRILETDLDDRPLYRDRLVHVEGRGERVMGPRGRRRGNGHETPHQSRADCSSHRSPPGGDCVTHGPAKAGHYATTKSMNPFGGSTRVSLTRRRSPT